MHKSVMLNETISALNIKDDGIYVDATLGYAGHSSEILKRLKRGRLFAFDQDEEARNYSFEKLAKINSQFKILPYNFVNMKKALQKEKIDLIDGILFDLGVSSPQIDNKERGFSFMQDAPLDMRMNKNNEKSAFEVINSYSEKKLLEIFFNYGEERKSKIIAEKIIQKRSQKEIRTTLELVEIIRNSVGEKYFNLYHPERKIFQAIRIEVNDELNVIKQVLPDAISLLKKGGRIVILTFHSLEDRIVKQIFKKYSDVPEIVKGLPEIPEEYKPLIKLVNKKPILPSIDEINKNSRSKSAKLRIVERI